MYLKYYNSVKESISFSATKVNYLRSSLSVEIRAKCLFLVDNCSGGGLAPKYAPLNSKKYDKRFLCILLKPPEICGSND